MPAEKDNTFFTRCCICSSKTVDLWKLSTCKENNGKTWIYKLRNCVGEIEWYEDDVICQKCSEHLDSAYNFRKMCLHSPKITQKKSDAHSEIKSENYIYHESEQKHKIDNWNYYIGKKSPEAHVVDELNSFFCTICSIPYSTGGDLEQHQKTIHSTEKQTTLDSCDSSDDSTYNTTESKYYIDNDTSDSTKNPSENCKIKRAIHSLARDFSCDICQTDCKSISKLITHSTAEHQLSKKDIKTYTCIKCTNKFRLASSLLQHLSYHDGLRDQICTFCGKGFMTRSDLISHEKIHSSELKYKCPDCDRTFKTHPNLRTHRMLKHTDRSTWPHQCSVCGKRFLMKSGYNAHMRMHNNERPFSCHLCGKSFIENGVLLKHLRTHSNVRAFKCPNCEKEYKDKHNMKIHMVREHKIGNIKVPKYNTTKKFFCHLCPKGFVEKSKLMRHLNSHTGERPYACSICDKRFTDKSYIRPHMRSVHNSLPD